MIEQDHARISAVWSARARGLAERCHCPHLWLCVFEGSKRKQDRSTALSKCTIRHISIWYAFLGALRPLSARRLKETFTISSKEKTTGEYLVVGSIARSQAAILLAREKSAKQGKQSSCKAREEQVSAEVRLVELAVVVIVLVLF